MSDPYRTSALVVRDEAAYAVVARELVADEPVVWAGRPLRGVAMREPLQTLAGVPFTAFSLFWMWMVAHAPKAPLFIPLFGLPFLLGGLYMLFGRLFVDARKREHTYYALTDRRVIIVNEGSTRKVVEVDLATCPEIHFEEHADGTGTIIFGRPVMQSVNQFNVVRPPELFRISDGRAVFTQLNEKKKLLLTGRGPRSTT